MMNDFIAAWAQLLISTGAVSSGELVNEASLRRGLEALILQVVTEHAEALACE